MPPRTRLALPPARRIAPNVDKDWLPLTMMVKGPVAMTTRFSFLNQSSAWLSQETYEHYSPQRRRLRPGSR